VTEITLEKLKFGVDLKVAKELSPEYVQNMIEYRVTGYVWAQDAGRPVEFSYPRDWWQAFKQRWLPFLPVEMKTVSFRVKATYPDLKIAAHEPVLRLLKDVSYETELPR